MTNNHYLDVLDSCLMDIEISKALFTESNTTDFFRNIKNTFNDLQIKAKEYAILQDSKLKSKDGKVISKYQKGLDEKVEYLLSLKSKNINSVDCYDYSKVRKAFPNMLESLSDCLEGTLLCEYHKEKDVDDAEDTFMSMLSEFSDLLDKYSNETRLNVDTCINILRNSDGNTDGPKYLSFMFNTLNKLENKLNKLDTKTSVGNHQYYSVKKAISKFGKFAIKWIKKLDENYDIEFTR